MRLYILIFCLLTPFGELMADAPQADSLLASTFFGGTGIDGNTETPIAIDAEGYVYIATRTASYLPTSVGAFDRTRGGANDLFVAKFTPDLTTLVACTYLGGSSYEGLEPGTDMTIDGDGNLIVVASTASLDFPTSAGAYKNTLTGNYDIAVAKLSNDLTQLIAATYLGGTDEESYAKVAVLDDGRIAIAGSTKSSNFPTTPGAVDSVYSGGPYRGFDIFVSVFDDGLTTLLASTYLGEAGEDLVEQFRVVPEGLLLGGWTSTASNFPTTAGAAYPTYRGGMYDGFLSIINDDLTSMVASTYLGGTDWDFVYGMTVDHDGNILASGHTASRYNFPITSGAYDRTYNSASGADVGDDSYITRFAPDLSSVISSSFLGGSGWENSCQIRTDSEGRVFVLGSTNSTNFPYTPGTFDSTVIPAYKYWSDGWICCFDSSITQLLFGTILGGSSNDGIGSCAFDAAGNLYVCGNTRSGDFPTTPGAFDVTINGGYFDWGGDIFVSAFAKGYWEDSDGDGHADFFDVCPDVYDPGQEDLDQNGVGDACCCVNLTGNIDGDPEDLIDIGDLTALIGYLFIPPYESPGCMAEGNVDGIGSIDIGDLTALIGYLFIPPNPEPAGCG